MTHFCDAGQESTLCGERPHHVEARGDTVTDDPEVTTCITCLQVLTEIEDEE